ncbi:DUF362 domain-containing protein [Halorubrum sp. CBA1125]|uniref:DUF362 domain-containing protein n=1 Tax=Halorubrum sp. CBA1125 TaxID=2668072 RepID=UPI0012E89A57|nr:DUF362 domain-containing protein [Halorubrum sp. CBA1125]MUW13226.1 DUF362 domain-containing protein [Halorubrum sp. CBA1125]
MEPTLDNTDVVVHQLDQVTYPDSSPFHPDTGYPEYPFSDAINNKPNPVYKAVRACFKRAGLDVENYGTANWNPLGELIESDDRVVLKPNFVKEDHPRDPDGWKYVLTHGSVIRAVADYVFLALGEDGQLIVADAPQTDSSFTKICERVGLYDIQDFYLTEKHALHTVDMRQEEWESEDGLVTDRRKLRGDPFGYTEFDLADASEFEDHPGEGDYYGADYDTDHVNNHHTGGRHEYLIAATAIEADVVFSLPKAKTHKKAGVTLSLKNLVGINGDKNYLPHHTEGEEVNDEHPDPDPTHRVEQAIMPIVRKGMLAFPDAVPKLVATAQPVWERIFGSTSDTVRSGNWWGNDTVWRMCLDLNKLLFYGNTDGTLRDDSSDSRKRHYSLCDGIVGGEARGPMDPDPKESGFLSFGTHPASVDAVTTYLMGFDPELIPIVRNAFQCKAYPLAEWGLDDISVKSNQSVWQGELGSIPIESTLEFEPHFGWTHHIEHGSEHSESDNRAQATEVTRH